MPDIRHADLVLHVLQQTPTGDRRPLRLVQLEHDINYIY